MDHSVYDGWKKIQNPVISNDGRYISCEISPGRGDETLWLYDLNNSFVRLLERGCQAVFSNNSGFLAWKIKPPDQLTRSIKRAGKSKKDLPEDSLGIMILKDGSVQKFARVQSFKVPEEGSSVLIIHHFPAVDTASADTALALEKKSPVKGGELKILDPFSNTCTTIPDVIAYNISKNGASAGFIRQTADSAVRVITGIYDCTTRTETILFEGAGRIGQFAIDEQGTQLAFLHNSDTAKVTGYALYHWSVKTGSVKKIADTLYEGLPDNWGISANGKLWFSEDGSRLFFGTSRISEPARKDTLLDDERVSVDIWNWNDDLLQSQQKVSLKDEQRRTYLAFYDFRQRRLIQLADTLVENIRVMHKGKGETALGFVSRPYNKWLSWKAGSYRDIYLLDMPSGNLIWCGDWELWKGG
jgi:hypothetical protein